MQQQPLFIQLFGTAYKSKATTVRRHGTYP